MLGDHRLGGQLQEHVRVGLAGVAVQHRQPQPAGRNGGHGPHCSEGSLDVRASAGSPAGACAPRPSPHKHHRRHDRSDASNLHCHCLLLARLRWRVAVSRRIMHHLRASAASPPPHERSECASGQGPLPRELSERARRGGRPVTVAAHEAPGGGILATIAPAGDLRAGRGAARARDPLSRSPCTRRRRGSASCTRAPCARRSSIRSG